MEVCSLNDEYMFDIDKIIEYVYNDDMPNDTEITDTYFVDEDTSEMVLNNRIIRGVNGKSESTSSTFKYDLIKMFITSLMTAETEGCHLTFGEKSVINTLVNKGFIKKIDK